MFQHLMVALDGSHLAESALAPAAAIALAMGARVTLLHVIENHPPEEVHGEPHLATIEDAHRYLESIAATLPPGLKVDHHVHPNREQAVARSIAEHAREFAVDLIVLCTHGRPSLRRWLYGTIAQNVIAVGRIPVLVTYPTDNPAPVHGCRRILVPLDGNPEHEASIAVACDLARVWSAQIHVVIVIPTIGSLKGEDSVTARFLPATARAVLDMSEEAAANYLNEKLVRIGKQGIEAAGAVRRGEPAATITLEAQRMRADMIVMATHGKSHMEAFWEGSVAPIVSGRTELPLMLTPVGDGSPDD